MKAFLTDALSSALDLGIASSDDVIRYVTPDVLAEHLPRPLWARLLTACLGASVVDATLIVETIGLPNLCEHVPAKLLWQCLDDVARKCLGLAASVSSAPPPTVDWSARPPTPPPLAPPPPTPPPAPAPIIAAPPPPAPAPEPAPPRERRPSMLPSTTPIPPPTANPLADLITELESETPPPRAKSITQGRVSRNTASGLRTNANTTRRPQASAPVAAVIDAGTTRSRRGQTEVSDYDIETDVRPAEDFRMATNDEQLVDWPAEETVSSDDYGRKR